MSSIKIKNKVTGNWEKLPTMKGKQGEKGNDGLGVPLGGTTGQILAKKSDTNNDTEWIDNNGSVVDTLNVENKITNAPSLRLFEENANEIEERLMVLDGNVVKNQNDITSLTDNKVNNSKQISIDLNTVTTTGFYYCNSCTNTPSGNGYLFSHRNSDKYMLHLFIPFGGGALYTRVRNNGTWNAWKEVMYKTGGTFTGKVAFNDTTTINAGLELSTATPYIDFHFGKSTNDYTSRILEISSGQLDFETPNYSSRKYQL